MHFLISSLQDQRGRPGPYCIGHVPDKINFLHLLFRVVNLIYFSREASVQPTHQLILHRRIISCPHFFAHCRSPQSLYLTFASAGTCVISSAMVSLLLLSAASGCFSRCFVHPLDTLRSRLMVSKSAHASLLKTLSEVISSDGLRGLYRGFGISVIMQAPAVATYLSTYDYAKAQIIESTPLPATAPSVHLGAGLIAETVSAVFWVPMEVIKQRAQVRTGAMSAATSSVIARDLIAKEGPAAFFKGYGLTVGVFGPYAMLYFMAYERFKLIAAEGNVDKTAKLDTKAIALCASGAGAFAGGLTTPLDVIKTRLQTQGDIQERGRGYQGTWHAAKVIAREEGLRAFWRGLSARVLWIAPNAAITFTAFEFLKQRFHNVEKDVR